MRFGLPHAPARSPSPTFTPLPRRKLSRPEYVLLWLTFLAICGFGLELGIGAGVVMATLFFASQYARVREQDACAHGHTSERERDTYSTRDRSMGAPVRAVLVRAPALRPSYAGQGNTRLVRVQRRHRPSTRAYIPPCIDVATAHNPSFLCALLWPLLRVCTRFTFAHTHAVAPLAPSAAPHAQSQVSGLRQVAARSGRTHVYDTSSTLDLLGRRLAVLRLSGYVFFGSSTGLGNSVLQLAARMLQVSGVQVGSKRLCT